MVYPNGELNEILEWFGKNKGKNIKIPYFLSTSKEDFKNFKIVGQIKTLTSNSKARYISNISKNKDEKVILFKRNSCFSIDSINREKGYINLIEIDDKSKIDVILVGSYYESLLTESITLTK